MLTATIPKHLKTKPPFFPGLPPLENGDRLTRTEFEQRYSLMPHVKKAELIKGIVYMASPVHYKSHGQPHAQIMGWLALYCAARPYIGLADNATVRLDKDTEVQPDALLRLSSENGGLSRVTENDYIEGPPELIVEIAATSATYDLHDKKKAYEKAGVQEYIVWRIYDWCVDWFYLEAGQFAEFKPDEKGIVQSRVFPGLDLNVSALLKGDMTEVLKEIR